MWVNCFGCSQLKSNLILSLAGKQRLSYIYLFITQGQWNAFCFNKRAILSLQISMTKKKMCFLFLDTMQSLFVPGSLFLPLHIFVDFNWGCLHANLDHRDRTEEKILDWLFFARMGWVWIAKLHVLTRTVSYFAQTWLNFQWAQKDDFFFNVFVLEHLPWNSMLPSGFKSVAAMNPQFCTRKKKAFTLSLLLNDRRFKIKATWKFQAYPFFYFLQGLPGVAVFITWLANKLINFESFMS